MDPQLKQPTSDPKKAENISTVQLCMAYFYPGEKHCGWSAVTFDVL